MPRPRRSVSWKLLTVEEFDSLKAQKQKIPNEPIFYPQLEPKKATYTPRPTNPLTPQAVRQFDFTSSSCPLAPRAGRSGLYSWGAAMAE
jgi:hypothetical protein